MENAARRPRVSGILPTGLTPTCAPLAQFQFFYTKLQKVSQHKRTINHSISLAFRYYSLTTRKSRSWRGFDGRPRSQHWREKLFAALASIAFNCSFSSVFP